LLTHIFFASFLELPAMDTTSGE